VLAVLLLCDDTLEVISIRRSAFLQGWSLRVRSGPSFIVHDCRYYNTREKANDKLHPASD
jgi:hypothetical protein